MRQQLLAWCLGSVAALDFLAAFEAGACPVCRVQEECLRRSIRWFLIEHYNSPPTLQRLQASHGFCWDHFAEIVVQTPTWQTWQMSFVTGVLIDHQRILVRRALASLQSPWKRLANSMVAVSKQFVARQGCPLCEDSRAWREWATRGLVDLWEYAEPADGLRGSTICLPDLAQAWRHSGRATRILIQRRALEDIARLLTAPTDGHDIKALKNFLCGEAPPNGSSAKGAPLASELAGWPRTRGRPRTFGPAAGFEAGTPVLECFQTSACPVCYQAETADARFLASQNARMSPELLCRAHLARLLEHTAQAKEPALVAAMARKLGEELAGAFASNGARPERRANCPACSEVWTTTQTAAEAVVAMLRTEPGATSFASTGVICARHLPVVLRSTGRAEAITVLQRYDTVLRRLAYLLAEYHRKRDYRYKDEPRGEEQEAWRQAIALLTGFRKAEGLR